MKIAIDFDGTCVDHSFPEVGEDAPGCVDVLKELVEQGHYLILNTMRSGEFLAVAVAWFAERGIPLFGVGRDPEQHAWTTSSKCYAEVYIDDAAFGCPLITVDGFRRQVVDWGAVREALVQQVVEVE